MTSGSEQQKESQLLHLTDTSPQFLPSLPFPPSCWRTHSFRREPDSLVQILNPS